MELNLTDEQLEQAVFNIAQTEDGQNLIGYLIARSNAFTTGYLGNSRDVYNKGRADVGLEIIELMELYATEQWLLMQKKDIEKRKKELEKEKGN